ncbi:MAG: hypothetical protein IJC69_01415 [Clostridia bacterium]|nr:hypothetical protein [Clostridia bacterium]
MVETGSNTFDFYEVPQARGAQLKNNLSARDFENTGNVQEEEPANNLIDPSSIEIDNIITNNKTNNGENNQQKAVIEVPKVKEIVIPRPQREPKEKGFVF